MSTLIPEAGTTTAREWRRTLVEHAEYAATTGRTDPATTGTLRALAPDTMPAIVDREFKDLVTAVRGRMDGVPGAVDAEENALAWLIGWSRSAGAVALLGAALHAARTGGCQPPIPLPGWERDVAWARFVRVVAEFDADPGTGPIERMDRADRVEFAFNNLGITR